MPDTTHPAAGCYSAARDLIALRERQHATPRDVARETAAQKAIARIAQASKIIR